MQARRIMYMRFVNSRRGLALKPLTNQEFLFFKPVGHVFKNQIGVPCQSFIYKYFTDTIC